MSAVKCLFPGCDSTAYSRGLCGKHYRAMMRIVKQGKVSLEALEKSGRIKASAQGNKDSAAESWFVTGKVNP